jgi:CelD/BcsL family acetyltransferase involved in cellulose biosynthesis
MDLRDPQRARSEPVEGRPRPNPSPVEPDDRPERKRALQLAPVTELELVRAEWAQLAAASRNVFGTWEWTSLWWAHFGQDRELAVTAATDDDGDVVAILPLYFWRKRPGRVLRFLGHGVSDQLGPICDPRDRVAAGDALLTYLEASRRRWHVFLAEHVPSQEGWHDHLDATLLRRETNPVLHDDGGGWEGFLASRTSNFRRQIGRNERKLAGDHDVRYRLVGEAARLESDLDAFFALHAARWSNGKSGFGGATEPFHRDFAARALERGWLRLWFLEVDGQPVAALYGFRFGGVESSYQAGRDPTWDDASVGFVLLAHAIRAALADGVTEYRLLRGDEPYKARFATRDHPLDTLGVASGPRGKTLVAAAGILRSSSRLRKALRARLEA